MTQPNRLARRADDLLVSLSRMDTESTDWRPGWFQHVAIQYRPVRVRLMGPFPPSYWCAALCGQERDMLELWDGTTRCYLDNHEGRALPVVTSEYRSSGGYSRVDVHLVAVVSAPSSLADDPSDGNGAPQTVHIPEARGVQVRQ